MSSYGLRVENPSGILVLDDNALGFNYVGRPTLLSAGWREPGALYPHSYQIVMPSAGAVPLVALGLLSDRISYIVGMVQSGSDPSGRTWIINAVSVELFGASSAPVPVGSELYVFAPAWASGAQFGCQISKPNSEIAWDLSMKQFWIRQALQFNTYTGTRNINGWVGDGAHVLGDAQPWDTAGISAPAIVGTPSGWWEITQDTTGENLMRGTYGWRLEGSAITRRQVWIGSDRPYDEVSPYDGWFYQIAACRPILIDRSGL